MTLGQAKYELASSSQGAYQTQDLVKSINKALRALVSLYPLKCFRKVYRFVSAGPAFVLPQGCAGLVRACVNGRPVTMRGQDFRFILSGPGDMDRPSFRPVQNIADLGVKPVMREPKRPFQLFAFVDSPAVWHEGDPVRYDVDETSPGDYAQPKLTVRGFSPEGREVSVVLNPFVHDAIVNDAVDLLPPSPEDPEGTVYAIPDDTPVFQEITSVTLGQYADGAFGREYVTLVARDYSRPECAFSIAVFNPKEVNPKFRHYELVGLPPDRPVEILAEVRMGHVDLVKDTDELPVDCTDPIAWMIRSEWEMNAGEVTRAETYRQKAEEWLRRQDATDSTVQTRITINSEFRGSPGEISMDAANI